ncbi:MAG: TetR/AcrR family transcriptional regulator [Methylobacterium mesophilicum]|nr:TetR/AcrR family transcriptional regulator [Methylobacterium mesophilicum]
MVVQDRRQAIVDAGLAVLREHGYSGFTQTRVAARAGLRQSHLTYYHPTRLDLLAAVGRGAVDRQLAAVETLLGALSSVDEMADAIASLITRHENTRVLMALAQAGDEAPRLRELFRELADGIRTCVSACLSRLTGEPPSSEKAAFLHSFSVGLAVVDLATGRPDGRQQAVDLLRTALRLLAADRPSAQPLSEGSRNTPDHGEG